MSTIDRDMLIKKYINPDIEKFHNSDVKIVLENLKQNILKMPSTDKPQGKWIKKEYNGIRYYECEKCCGEVLTNYYYYCPWCGVKLKGASR